MAKFRKRPVVVEAFQAKDAGRIFDKLHDVHIPFEAGDWIITGIHGEQYPCKADVFAQTYEAVDE